MLPPRHIMRSQSTQDTRVQSDSDDVASNVRQALPTKLMGQRMTQKRTCRKGRMDRDQQVIGRHFTQQTRARMCLMTWRALSISPYLHDVPGDELYQGIYYQGIPLVE